MTHPVDELMKRMLDLGPEGFEELAREAEAEVETDDLDDIPETVEVKYADGEQVEIDFREQVRAERAMRNLFDKLTEGIDLDADEEE